MRKFVIILFIFFLFPVTAKADYGDFISVLDKEISSFGVYSSAHKNGIVYAALSEFRVNSNTQSLFITRLDNSKFEIICEIWEHKNTSSPKYTLKLPYYSSSSLSLAWDGKVSCIQRDSAKGSAYSTEYLYISDKGLEHYPDFKPIKRNDIISVSFGKINCMINCANDNRQFYNFFNALKCDYIGHYAYPDRINSMDREKYDKIQALTAACINLKSYDIYGSDYDTFFLSILRSGKSFSYLSSLSPDIHYDKGGIGFIDSEYVNYICNLLFDIMPQRPPYSHLSTRGFCYKDGEYLFIADTPKKETSYKFEGIKSILDIGGGVYCIIFSDIKTENNISIPEYSFMILRERSDGTFKIMRLDTGILPPENDELKKYSPFDESNNTFINPGTPRQNAGHGSNKNAFIYVFAVLLIIFAILLYRYVRKKK